MLPVQEFDERHFVVMGTRKGTVKKTELSAFSNPRAGGIIAMGVETDDEVMAVRLSDGDSEIFIGSQQGMAIRFPESDVRSMGRTAYGVRGIQLRDGDEVVAMEVVKPGGTLLTVTQKGYAKRTDLEEYRVQSRGGLGLKNLEITDKNGLVVGIAQVHENEELLVITQQGKILRTPASDIRTIGRATQGVRVMDLGEEDSVVSVALVERDEEVVVFWPRQGGGAQNGQNPEGPARRSRSRLVMAPLALLATCLLASAGAAVSRPVLPRRPRARQRDAGDDVGGRRSDPREQGEVTDFEITAVCEERRTPLDFKTLIAAAAQAVAEEADFRKRKLDYQNANLPGPGADRQARTRPGGEDDARPAADERRMGQVAGRHDHVSEGHRAARWPSAPRPAPPKRR